MLPPRHRLTKTRARIRQHTKGRRTFVQRRPGQSFEPTEDWHEPAEKAGYRVIVRNPGKGYRHVVTEDQIRDRLARLPQQFLKDLDVVQLACMTRKKNRFPYYGLQWGTAIYLYPFEENLEETFYRPPPRALVIEAKMFGGQIIQDAPGVWKLIWSESAARDFQLNNVLIHELGHLVDSRNTTYTDQERFAEWFAIQYGYLRSGGQNRAHRTGPVRVRRRHHGV